MGNIIISLSLSFFLTVRSGSNHIVRKSEDSTVTVPDPLSLEALASASDSDLDAHSRLCGIPNRLLLPKGKTTGMAFALVVGVTDGNADKATANPEASHSQCGVHGETYPDKRPMGYPLDRSIPDIEVFRAVPNMKQAVVKVFHQA